MPLFRPTDRNLPLAVQFWGEALRSLDPGIADESTWLIAPIPPLSFCSWRCRCEELVAAEFVGLQNLSHLGVSVEEWNSESEFPEKVIKTIRRELRRNRVVVWFDQGSAGIIRESTAMNQIASSQWSASGRRSERTGTVEQILQSRIYRLSTSNRRVQARGVQKWHALLNASTTALRPSAIGTCPRNAVTTTRGWGPGAIHALLSSTAQCPSIAGIHHVVARWKVTCALAESGLKQVAGAARRRPDNQLRQASALCVDAANSLGHLDSVLKDAGTADPQDEYFWHELRGGITHAAAFMEDASLLTVEAALTALGVGESLRAAFIEEGPPSGEALEELLYVARSGGARFRQLAARRLAGIPDKRAIVALSQLLFDRDSAVSDTALSAVARLPAKEMVPRLRGVYPNVPDTRVGSSSSLRPGIIAVLAGVPGSEDVLG